MKRKICERTRGKHAKLKNIRPPSQNTNVLLTIIIKYKKKA